MTPVAAAAPDDDNEMRRKQAAAIKDRRKEEGSWSNVVRAHTDYQTLPLEWIVEKLGVPEHTIRWSMNEGYADHKWDADFDPIVRILETLARGDDVGVESATGTGKSFIAACIVLWFLACFEDSLVVTSAPKADQLFDIMWKEIGRLWPAFAKHFPDAELLTGKIRMKPAEDDREVWSATAFVCGVGASEESATKAQGYHAAHMLIISEETPGIHPAILEAFANTRTDDHNIHLALGNPDHQHDPLHVFCMEDGVEHIIISAFDHPNIVCQRSVIPGAIGPKRLEKRIKKYGKGSRFYESRIRGLSPAEAEDALIKWEWCLLAAKKYDDERYRVGLAALGVDVANSESGDKGAIARWQGSCCTEVEQFPCPDANQLGARVVKEAQEMDIDQRHIGVDSVGVGAGTMNEGKRLGWKFREISSAKRAVPRVDTDTLWSEVEESDHKRAKAAGPTVIEAERFDNLRSQVMWWMREDLRLGRVALPHDEDLFRDLTTATYKTKGGVIRVQTKEEMKVHLKRSPNQGDACCYGNWVRRRRPVLELPPEDPFKNQADRDFGLERIIAAEKKRVAAAERDFKKRLKRMYRKRTGRR